MQKKGNAKIVDVEPFEISGLTINKDVNIKFSAHDAFLEKPSSGTLNIEIFESQII
jgi:hypothetical protein